MNKLRAYTLFSSSKGNSTYVCYGKDSFLIDAGASMKGIGDAIESIGGALSGVRGIFVSHEHSDHTKGLEVISKKHGIPIYTDPKCMELIGISAPTAEEQLIPTLAGDIVHIGDIQITVYPTPHDSIRSFCYRIETPAGSLGYATDIGHISDEVQDALFGCDSVLIESNHDTELLKLGPYPSFLKARIAGQRGHLSNAACACLVPVLARCGTRSVTLAHLSETNNTPKLAFEASKARLKECNVSLCGEDFAGDLRLQVAAVSAVTEITI